MRDEAVLNTEQEQQIAMHRNLFDRCRTAIENGCYFEAIMLEYAAIEGRLEVMLGVMGMPCSKNCPCRKDIKISSRIQCIQYIRKHSCNFDNTKLDEKFFSNKGNLKKWISDRNILVHGLYKRPQDYISRIELSKRIAEEGLEIIRKLFNDASRLRRLKTNHPDRFLDCNGMCQNQSCKAFMNN